MSLEHSFFRRRPESAKTETMGLPLMYQVMVEGC